MAHRILLKTTTSPCGDRRCSARLSPVAEYLGDPCLRRPGLVTAERRCGILAVLARERLQP